MRIRPFYVIPLTLLLAALACSMPGYVPAGQPISSADAMSTIAAYAAQTLAAQTGVTPAAPTAQPAALSTDASLAATQSARLTQAAAAAATQQAGYATATALAIPPALPTANPVQPTFPPPVIPPAQPPVTAGRIRFARGATSAVVDGSLKKGAADDYLINIGARQYLIASVYSPDNSVYLGVTAPDGASLLRAGAGRSDFSMPLSLGGDYRLTVSAPAQKSSYTLQTIIPARIQFQAGAVSARTPGYLPAKQVNYYLAWAKAGQRMSVSLTSPHNDVFLTIYGLQDGSPLVRSIMGQTTWSDVLNLTQDYMIQAVSVGGDANYTLDLTIQ